MTPVELHEYNMLMANYKQRLDVIEIKSNANEDPFVIEKIVKEADYILSKCYQMNVTEKQKSMLESAHHSMVSIQGILDLVKSCGWMIFQNE